MLTETQRRSLRIRVLGEMASNRPTGRNIALRIRDVMVAVSRRDPRCGSAGAPCGEGGTRRSPVDAARPPAAALEG